LFFPEESWLKYVILIFLGFCEKWEQEKYKTCYDWLTFYKQQENGLVLFYFWS